MNIRGVCYQRGATAIEFALVFPLLFMLFYSVIVYSYLFVLQQSVSYAAQEAAAAAHRVDPVAAAGGFDQAVVSHVCPRFKQSLTWLTDSQQSRMGVNQCGSSALGDGQGGTRIEITPNNVVTVTSQLRVRGMFPALTMPLIGSLPPMPDTLIGSGTALVGET